MKMPVSLPALLAELVALPSVSPEGDSDGTAPGEAALAAHLANLLRELGAQVRLTEVQPGRPNLVARFPSRDRRAPVVALVPHLDTVGVAGMTVPSFRATVSRGRLHGRGACDTKGPMAAALWGLAAWLRTPAARSSHVTWVFAATMGEEELSTGASALCRAGFRADFAIALEPTDLKIVHAAKGVLRVWVDAAGRAAHGATPHRGRNAAYRLLPFLDACAHRLAPQFARRAHPLLGGASLNVGVVRAGGELNIVPDAATAGLDVRTHPAFDNTSALRALRGAARGLRLRVHRQGPAFALERSHPWLRRLAPHANGFLRVPWFSDANVFNAHGIPAVAFGPGSIAQAHTKDEFITLAALERGGRAFQQLIADLSARPPATRPR
ncbi:MAG: M20/M25/M40 family metallo-hydrolase [Candidatus Didemnitutus sp.]|nr:M20/M25/M40 family metallo-hydrolase [Candidatus Didemnitutus sp.]